MGGRRFCSGGEQRGGVRSVWEAPQAGILGVQRDGGRTQGHGAWLLKTEDPVRSGGLLYWSREGAAARGDPSLAPRLVLEFPSYPYAQGSLR